MGNTGSHCLDDYLNDLATFFPGLEVELENAYNACTEDGKLSEQMHYADVEPIIRHFLFNIGFGEYLLQLTEPDGSLRLSEVVPLFKSVGIKLSLNKPLSLDDWKILMLAWVRRIQELQRDEIKRWSDKMTEMQQRQELRLQAALRAFKVGYINQMQTYYDEVSRKIDQEFKLRQKWEQDQSLRAKFCEEQSEYCKEMTEKSAENYKQREMATQREKFIKLMQEQARRTFVQPLEGAKRVFTYTYPVLLTKEGVPLSGGYRGPAMRPRCVKH